MANYQVIDAYGSVITIQSSTFGGAERQIVGVSIIGALTTTPSGNQSVSGTVGASIIGSVPVTFSGSPSISGAVTVIGNPSISGTVGASVIGTVPITQSGTIITSLVSTVPSSVIVGASIFGLAPVNVTNTNLNVGGSVVVFQGAGWSGSVAATIVNTNVNVSGSVVAHQGTNPWVIQSIVGTYAEDAGHTTADKGLLTLGVRNDTVASFVSADLDYAPKAVDSAGRTVIKPFAPEESRVEGYISLTSTSVTTLVAAAGAGLRNYITDLWVANTGATTTLVTLSSGGGASVLGYTIAPTGGGSNLIGLQTPIRTGVNETFGIQAATATSTLYATVKGFKAP